EDFIQIQHHIIGRGIVYIRRNNDNDNQSSNIKKFSNSNNISIKQGTIIEITTQWIKVQAENSGNDQKNLKSSSLFIFDIIDMGLYYWFLKTTKKIKDRDVENDEILEDIENKIIENEVVLYDEDEDEEKNQITDF